MNKGRKPSCGVIHSLDGLETTTRGLSENINGENHNEASLNNQQLLSGNRIFHDPIIPKVFTPPANHRRPASIQSIIDDFSASYFNHKFHKSFYSHLDENGVPTRKIRSEFREMISMGSAILTHYYDVHTGEIGFTNDDGHYIRLCYKQLAKKLNVSLIRIKRFFNFMQKRGLVKVIQNKTIDKNGNWKSNVSRIIVNARFFIDTLGIGAWKRISLLREWCRKKMKPKTEKNKENLSLMGSMMGSFGKSVKKSYEKPVEASMDEYNQKKLLALAQEMYEKDPSTSALEYLRQLKANLT